MDNKRYNEQRYNRKKQMYRFLLGIQQLINYPLINILWIFVIVGIKYLITVEREIFLNVQVPSLLLQIFKGCIFFVEILIPLLLVLGIVQGIGTLIAIRDEALVSKAFGSNKDYRYEPPILSKKETKKGVTIREFYTTISMEEWKNKTEDICDKLDIHLIGDITYGGKNENTGYLRKMVSAKGRKSQNKGVLYDDIF